MPSKKSKWTSQHQKILTDRPLGRVCWQEVEWPSPWRVLCLLFPRAGVRDQISVQTFPCRLEKVSITGMIIINSHSAQCSGSDRRDYLSNIRLNKIIFLINILSLCIYKCGTEKECLWMLLCFYFSSKVWSASTWKRILTQQIMIMPLTPTAKCSRQYSERTRK